MRERGAGRGTMTAGTGPVLDAPTAALVRVAAAVARGIGPPGLDLKRRKLCTVATTAVLGTADQLHSHLRGALNTGASGAEIEAVLGLVEPDLSPEHRQLAGQQWADVKKRKL